MKVGYARVSSVSQNLDSQLKSLNEYGCEKIFQEKVSGTSTQGRDKLKQCLEFVREGDEFVITRIDRCSRSILDLQLIVKQLKEKGVTISATEQPISNKDATGKFGRILGELWRTTDFADKSLNEYLIEKELAEPYFGGKR